MAYIITESEISPAECEATKRSNLFETLGIVTPQSMCRYGNRIRPDGNGPSGTVGVSSKSLSILRPFYELLSRVWQ